MKKITNLFLVVFLKKTTVIRVSFLGSKIVRLQAI